MDQTKICENNKKSENEKKSIVKKLKIVRIRKYINCTFLILTEYRLEKDDLNEKRNNSLYDFESTCGHARRHCVFKICDDDPEHLSVAALAQDAERGEPDEGGKDGRNR